MVLVMKAVIQIKSRIQDYKIEPFVKEMLIESGTPQEFYRQSLQEFMKMNQLKFTSLPDLINHGFCICTFDTKANVYFPAKLSFDQVDWLYSLKKTFANYGPFIQVIDKENIEMLFTKNPLEEFYDKVNKKSQRKAVIIPNEYTINKPIFERILIGKDRHGMAAKEFSDLYHLGLIFQNIGLEEDSYNGYVWFQAISMLGHLSLQIDDFDKIAVLHIPEIITPKQLKWVNREFLKEIEGIDNINACSIRKTENDYLIKEFVSDTQHEIFALDSILKEVEMKYLLGNLKYGLVGDKYESKNK